MSAQPLVGRDGEMAQIEERLNRVSSQGAVLVVRGEAGVGKSVLLDAARSSAISHGFTLLATAGFVSEAHLPFAGLHRLLRPLLASVDRLPAPQRSALEIAFGLQSAAAPDFYLVALATLDLLSNASAASPILITVEEAESLDVATSDVLSFVARRIDFEPLVMLFAVRDGVSVRIDRGELPELFLEPLDDESASELLRINAPALDAGARRRVLLEAHGNPLALVELPHALGLGLDQDPSAPLPLTDRLERAFGARVADLPQAVRTLLLVAALDEGGDQERILEAASVVESRSIGINELRLARRARALAPDGDGLRFHHPLVRSAVRQSALAPDRRAAHRALAGVYQDDPDRGAWHRAASVLGPDDDSAIELESLAGRAINRGDAAAAVAALDLASRLTTDEQARGRLLLRAAWLSLDLGQLDVGVGLLHEAQRLNLDAREKTMLRFMLVRTQEDDGLAAAGIRSLVEIADQFHELGEIDLALDALEVAASRSWWENPDPGTRSRIVDAVDRLPVSKSNPRVLAIVTQADPVHTASTAIDRMLQLTPDSSNPDAALLVGSAANAVWAYDLALPFLGAAVDGLRTRGRLGMLAQALAAQAWAAVHLAREPLAVSAAEEAISLARETGQLQWAVVAELAKAAIAAERGDLGDAEVMVGRAEVSITQMGAKPMLAMAQFVRGRGAMVQGRFAEGFEHLRRALDPSDASYHPFIGSWGLSDMVEAAVRLDMKAEAALYLNELRTLAAETSGSLLLATLAYAEAVAANDDAAAPLFAQAAGIDLINWPCYRGRIQLGYGRWLRRQRRVAESRSRLRAALEIFDALAFPSLAKVARDELRAAGEKTEQEAPDAWLLLTPQELQIAQLASEGETNRTIGAQLYLSPRTVQSHLYRIFPKLGITARSQLRDVLMERDVA